ncbi:MAG: DUF1353 domain-containing protein [Pseudomonas sp.]|uniref:DUF1353 domain-containing protein n=1 Tax=Pseudomonas sp. TaxID=306 RepID=UPI00273600F1|nr:DUF1353 domain-containing protein [Pseudomonas sp.]MDP3848642.1 DUF1353 domain-containing protein [Pseudomonas sp.]
MSSFTAFTAPLDVRYDAEASKALGADHWRVTQPFRFYVGSEASGEWVNVPSGYLTDGASVPQVLWSLIPPWGAYGQAAVVHDILCEYLATTKDGVPQKITRARCDEILLEAMVALGVPVAKRCAIYRAVSLYRRLSGVDAPTSTVQKRALEAAWPVP